MNTSEHIESIPNDAKFERLATLILREVDQNFAAIIHLGVNAQGKTITSPSDGFCRVPYSDPPHFLWAQHTTESRAGLRSKWLSVREDKLGDLMKAAREAQKLKVSFPNACFTVILSTNQRIPTSQEPLAHAVYTKGTELGLEVIIYEQSLYAGFLDSHREGHWFRKEFFGTDAEMLSTSLLAELSTKSLSVYQKEQFTHPENWVARQLDGRIWEQMANLSCGVKLLVGEAGFGKSAAAYRFLERHVAADGCGLYISDSIIQASYSLEDALQQTLQRLYPSLLSKEAALIPDFIPANSHFIIVIDDISRTHNPSELIRKLVGWVAVPYIIVCPVWPRFWRSAKDLENKLNVDVIYVDRMLETEGIEAVQKVVELAGFQISRIESYKIAGKLQFDPLLIGSFNYLLPGIERKNIADLVNDTVEKHIEKCLADICNSEDKYFEHEYISVLNKITAYMLRDRKLYPYPHWNTIVSWLQTTPEHLDILRVLCSHGKLCQVTKSGDFRFHHDRFLVHFAINSIATFLSNRTEYEDVLSEPYYAEFIGEALLKSPQSPLVLDEIRNKNPLALVSCIRSIGIPTTEYHEMIIRKVGEWVSYAGRASHTPEALRGAVANSFLNADSPAVLEIVNTDFGLEVNWLGYWARFRNGDALAGAYYCRIAGMERNRDSFWEELVEHAKLNHRNMLVEGIKQIIVSQNHTADVKKAAVILIGFLALPELHEVVDTWWREQSDKPASLRVALWAVLRCSHNYHEDALFTSLITYWNDLPDVDDNQQSGFRQQVAERVGAAIAPDVHIDQVRFLINQARKRPKLAPFVAFMCGMIDLPEAIEFAVRQCAKRERLEQFRCSVSHWGSSIFPKLLARSVLQLQNVWESKRNSSSVRRLAFQLWLDNVDLEVTEIIGIISMIPSNSPFFSEVLWARVRFGDTQCVSDLITWLNSDMQFFRVVHYVWCEELMHVTNQHLKSLVDKTPQDYTGGLLNDHYWLAELMRMIPTLDAEKMLAESWGHLHYSRLFVQAALCISTPKSLELAAEAINSWPTDVPLFTHLAFMLGADGQSKSHRLTLQHFKNLQPYLGLFDEDLLQDIGEICYKRGGDWMKWCIDYVPTSVNDRCRMAFCPRDEDLLQRFEANAGQHPNYFIHMLHKFIDQTGSARRFLDVLGRWLRKYPTYPTLFRVARCVQEVGSREDLDILDASFESDWEKRQATIIKESVRFAIYRRTLQ